MAAASLHANMLQPMLATATAAALVILGLAMLYPAQIARLIGRGRKQRAGCLPLRMKNGNLQLLLVTSRRAPQWYTFPAGGIEPGEMCAEAAARETLEEAGAVGQIGRLVSCIYSAHACTSMFAMWVETELESWPEQRERKRQWFDLGEPGSPVKSRLDGVRSTACGSGVACAHAHTPHCSIVRRIVPSARCCGRGRCAACSPGISDGSVSRSLHAAWPSSPS